MIPVGTTLHNGEVVKRDEIKSFKQLAEDHPKIYKLISDVEVMKTDHMKKSRLLDEIDQIGLLAKNCLDGGDNLDPSPHEDKVDMAPNAVVITTDSAAVSDATDNVSAAAVAARNDVTVAACHSHDYYNASGRRARSRSPAPSPRRVS